MPTLTRADLDAALAQFHAVGLVPVLSTNGGILEADVQVVRVLEDHGAMAYTTVIAATASNDVVQRFRSSKRVYWNHAP